MMSELVKAPVPPPSPIADQSNDGVFGKTAHAYFDLPGSQIYNVLHQANTGNPRAAVLLCGPIGTERERSYPTFVKWSRLLSARGCNTMRFDYRGIGESSGRFEDMTMTDWLEDAAFCANQLSEKSPGVPLILHGTRAGALIASKLFASGVGDAQLLWAPPLSGHALLWDTLRRNLAAQMVNNPGSPRQTREQLVAAMETGEFINVDGYFWSRNLWRDAQLHTLALPVETELRPWHIVRINNLATSPAKPSLPEERERHVKTIPFWEDSSLFCPSSDELFQASLQWLESSVLVHGKLV